MEYTVTQTKQIAVTADDPEEAQKIVLNGEGAVISSTLNAQPRPQPTQQGISGANIQTKTMTKLPTTTTVQPTNG